MMQKTTLLQLHPPRSSRVARHLWNKCRAYRGIGEAPYFLYLGLFIFFTCIAQNDTSPSANEGTITAPFFAPEYTQEEEHDPFCALPDFLLISHQAPFYRSSDCGVPSLTGVDSIELDTGIFTLYTSGFVKSTNGVDTRQVAGTCNNQGSIIPAPPDFDPCGKDILKRGLTFSTAIYSRLQLFMVGKPSCPIQAACFMEVDFGGPLILIAQDNTNCRETGVTTLRHLFIHVAGDSWRLLAGNFWHPLVPIESPITNPTTFAVSPFASTARAPQLRVTLCPSDTIELFGAAASQTDFLTNGPLGLSPFYVQRSMIPNFHVQIKYHEDEDFVCGLGIDFKRIIPRLVAQAPDGLLSATHQGVSSWAAIAYNRTVYDPCVFTGIVTYGGNLTDQILLGGYGVSARDPVTFVEHYTPLQSISVLFDGYIRCCWEPGISIGFAKNLGSRSPLFIDPILKNNERFIMYGFTGGAATHLINGLESVLGIIPRCKWHHNGLTIAAALEWTHAQYGLLDQNGRARNTMPVDNIRCLFDVYYSF